MEGFHNEPDQNRDLHLKSSILHQSPAQ